MVFIVNRMTFFDSRRQQPVATVDWRMIRQDVRTMRIDDVELGDELPEERPDVSLETVRRFVKAAQMDFPRFTDHEHARAEGLPGAVIPGIMSQGQLAAMIHRWAPGCDDPQARHRLPHPDGRRHARGLPRRGHRTSRTTARSRST